MQHGELIKQERGEERRERSGQIKNCYDTLLWMCVPCFLWINGSFNSLLASNNLSIQSLLNNLTLSSWFGNSMCTKGSVCVDDTNKIFFVCHSPFVQFAAVIAALACFDKQCITMISALSTVYMLLVDASLLFYNLTPCNFFISQWNCEQHKKQHKNCNVFGTR